MDRSIREKELARDFFQAKANREILIEGARRNEVRQLLGLPDVPVTLSKTDTRRVQGMPQRNNLVFEFNNNYGYRQVLGDEAVACVPITKDKNGRYSITLIESSPPPLLGRRVISPPGGNISPKSYNTVAEFEAAITKASVNEMAEETGRYYPESAVKRLATITEQPTFDRKATHFVLLLDDKNSYEGKTNLDSDEALAGLVRHTVALEDLGSWLQAKQQKGVMVNNLLPTALMAALPYLPTDVKPIEG